MTRRLLAMLAALLLAVPLGAQTIGSPQNITVVDSGTACVTAPTACAIYALDSQTGGVTINVFGTWTGTLTFEGTNNNGIWVSVLATNVATGAQATTTTANGLFTITNVGVILVRARATAAITGTAQITAAKGWGFARMGPTSIPGSFTAGGLITAGNPGFLTAFDYNIGSLTGALYWTNGAVVKSTATGVLTVANYAGTSGSEFKVDALPTVGSGFGGSPSVTAGSTPLAGSVNVGTGGAATTGVITFGGTAYPSAPVCTYSTTTTNAVTRGTPTTTQLTLNSTTAWLANDIVTWQCISSK